MSGEKSLTSADGRQVAPRVTSSDEPFPGAVQAAGAISLAVILPVLNEAATIAGQLCALQPLRQRGVTLIVVDGGSDDATVELARPAVDTLLVAPRGRAWQMNAGAAASEQQTLLFLHADTRLPADAVEAITRAVAEGARWGRFDVRIDGQPLLLRLVERMINWRSRYTGIATGDQAMFVHRATFVAVGGFPEQPLMEDIELSLRLKRRAPPACLRQRVVTSARRWQQHGVLRTILLMWSLRARYFFGADPWQLARRYGYAPRPPDTGNGKQP